MRCCSCVGGESWHKDGRSVACWVESEVRVGSGRCVESSPAGREIAVGLHAGRTTVSSVGRLEGSERSDAGRLLPYYQSSLSFTSVKGTRI
ncbi:hypothetical protein QQF64_001852 [Cirrhinus molitorella]|uniref:Uncharacterized protein n=1 Tax=Cirrhinus molitorella TaxID=172907 RepID=A0ABR3MNG6_9TELE